MIWIIGDDFVNDTVGEYLQADDENKPYMWEYYDVKVLCSSSLSLNTSVTVRLHNNVVNVLEVKPTPFLPKAIIFVLDGDIIKTVHHKMQGISEIFGQVLKNLIMGIHKFFLAYKEKLPNCSKRGDFPSTLWVLPPLHKNFPEIWNLHCKKFVKCLETIVQLNKEMGTLKMLKIWDPEDYTLFRDKCFTAAGLQAYWNSIDSTFHHWDTFIFVKARMRGVKSPFQNRQQSMVQPTAEHNHSVGRMRIIKDVQRFKRSKASGKFHWNRNQKKSDEGRKYNKMSQ